MNLNNITYVIDDENANVDKHKIAFALPPIHERTFPTHVTHRDITTKPEDQGDYGSCAMHTMTTVCEMIVWKLTGIYMEFSDDEIYNIYLDCQKTRYGTASNVNRLAFRTLDNGKWFIPKKFDHGETIYMYDYGVDTPIVGDNPINYTYMTALYNIIHYNDPDHRQNHYPDNFSIISFIVKNYLYNNMYRYAFDNDWTPLSPNIIKHISFCSNFPMRCGIPGHATTFYQYDNLSIDLNSSWNKEYIDILRFPYNTTIPYYTICYNMMKTPDSPYYIDSRFSDGIKTVEFFDRKLSSIPNVYTVQLSNLMHGRIFGIAQDDQFPSNTSIQLSACADNGYYFNSWHDGDISNPRTFTISSDIEIGANFTTEQNPNIFKTVYVLTSDIYDISVMYNESKITTNQFQVCYGSTINVECIINDEFKSNGAVFNSWNDGNTSNPRTYIVYDDLSISPMIDHLIDIADDSIIKNIDIPYNSKRYFYSLSADVYNYVSLKDANNNDIFSYKINTEQYIEDLTGTTLIIPIDGIGQYYGTYTFTDNQVRRHFTYISIYDHITRTILGGDFSNISSILNTRGIDDIIMDQTSISRYFYISDNTLQIDWNTNTKLDQMNNFPQFIWWNGTENVVFTINIIKKSSSDKLQNCKVFYSYSSMNTLLRNYNNKEPDDMGDYYYTWITYQKPANIEESYVGIIIQI